MSRVLSVLLAVVSGVIAWNLLSCRVEDMVFVSIGT